MLNNTLTDFKKYFNFFLSILVFMLIIEFLYVQYFLTVILFYKWNNIYIV